MRTSRSIASSHQLLRTSKRSEKLIEGLLVLAESDRGLPGKVPVALDELAGSVLKARVALAGKHGVSLRHTLARRVVPGDPVLLEQLLGNLLRNAIAYNQLELPHGTRPAQMRQLADRASGPLAPLPQTSGYPRDRRLRRLSSF